MRVKNGAKVTFHYELKGDDGKLLDSTYGIAPVVYIHGEEEIIEGLEDFLDGEEAGFEAKVTIEPEKGYGYEADDLLVVASPENFDDNVDLVEGNVVETEDPDGNPINFRITKIVGDKVYLDGNHPLAGKRLHYKVEILSVE
ncbi:FKBP-type peptidyl-prolyl cis-trans isomerase [Thiomicrospira microaerophila]|jgi:FKBP-type peptidyl-prolyl cis-trans isomerase SlyD|uniref:FKBP-type peptidyl-prolyl cis-trans isomerase n=1 Tax=Thiomicrospira microaerophila TaxID=406020 RepID=UPI00200DC81B|nr:FKBP-type peptidyl-prolyl cis-trans isomerase [Thiomicrospira microaerophila]UQB41256.1 FKBP-type peptidyl-prolyl cis-trans isomerase [Thiomicrospira microaerophila]